MQGYESIIILDPNLTEENQTALLQKLKETVEGQGGSVVHQTQWGRRKLAYPVKKMDYGHFYLLYLDHQPQALKAMENVMRLGEEFLKWQTVSVENLEEEFTKFETLKNEGSVAQNLSDR